MVTHSPSKNVSLARAGAVSEYVGGVVLFCGGKDGVEGMHDDCLVYDPSADEWSEHSRMSVPRLVLTVELIGLFKFGDRESQITLRVLSLVATKASTQ